MRRRVCLGSVEQGRANHKKTRRQAGEDEESGPTAGRESDSVRLQSERDAVAMWATMMEAECAMLGVGYGRCRPAALKGGCAMFDVGSQVKVHDEPSPFFSRDELRSDHHSPVCKYS